MNRLRGREIYELNTNPDEQLFQVPPFTPEVAAAVRLISTRVSFSPDEQSRLVCQMEANSASESEYFALAPLFAKLPKPRRVLEIGPGYGRSVVYFGKKGVWEAGSEIHLYDADGTQTKYKQKHYDRPPQWPDVSSFCGSLSTLRQFLDYNGVANYRIFNASEVPLRKLPGPYDLIYGFFSIGFHWSLEYYLDDLGPLLNETSLLICTLNKHFRPFAALKNYSVRILDCRDIKKNAVALRLLVLRKDELPNVGRTLTEAFPGWKS